jgi:hypothetical protein
MFLCDGWGGVGLEGTGRLGALLGGERAEKKPRSGRWIGTGLQKPRRGNAPKAKKTL